MTGSLAAHDPPGRCVAILVDMEPMERLRSAGKRVTDPLEGLAQGVAERVIDLVIHALDINALIQQIDVEALVAHTDFGEIIAKSSSGAASAALDSVRGQTVNLDGAIDRGVWRLVRRNAARPAGPPALVRPQAES
jgi:hypothetical protein